MKRIMVLGIGNLLMSDDGFGVHVVRKLAEMGLPDTVELVDGGTHSYDLLDYFEQSDICFVVDSMHTGGKPGTVYRAPLDELGLTPNADIQSLHEISFAEAMHMVRLLGHNPEVIVYGIEPEYIDIGLELTPVVAEKVDWVAGKIYKEISDLLSS